MQESDRIPLENMSMFIVYRAVLTVFVKETWYVRYFTNSYVSGVLRGFQGNDVEGLVN